MSDPRLLEHEEQTEQPAAERPSDGQPRERRPRRIPPGEPHRGPLRWRLFWIGAGVAVLLLVLLAIGYFPRRLPGKERGTGVADKKQSLPEVSVLRVIVAPAHSDLLLPGNITPLTEAVLSARADGYL